MDTMDIDMFILWAKQTIALDMNTGMGFALLKRLYIVAELKSFRVVLFNEMETFFNNDEIESLLGCGFICTVPDGYDCCNFLSYLCLNR